MPVIETEGLKIVVDEEGYLINFGDWNEKVACILADKEGISEKCPLTKEKVEILKFMRDYYQKFEAVPIPWGVCLRIHQPKDCTYEQFPDPTIAWKIAGLPQPSRHVISSLKGWGGVS
jgi:TusE/DsrC/DsvC family sulfur relay protein